MNKTTKENVNHLRRLVGHKVIRKGPTAMHGDFSYTEDPLILVGFTEKGKIICRYAEETFLGRIFGSRENVLPLEFTDRNWMLYSRVTKGRNSELSKWNGRKILRTRPTARRGDKSFMEEPVKLIAASKYHLVVEFTSVGLEGSRHILN